MTPEAGPAAAAPVPVPAQARVLLARALAVVALLVVLAAAAKGRLEVLDAALWDRLQQRLPAPAPSLEVTLVAIDESSLSVLGEPPLDRVVYARALDVLREAQARAVVLDVFFEENRTPGSDEALRRALAAGEALVPFELSRRRRTGGNAGTIPLAPRGPAPGLATVAARTGFANLPVGATRDGVYRKVWLARGGQDQGYPSLGLALVRHLGETPASTPEALVRLDYRALRDPERFPQVSLRGLLARTPAALEMVRGRVCFLGATAARLGDVKDTPLGRRPGALVHAVVAENLVGGRIVREAAVLAWLGTLLLGLLCLARVPPAGWMIAGPVGALSAVVASAVLAMIGVYLPAGPAILSGLCLALVGLGSALAPDLDLSSPITLDSAREALENELAEGDDRTARVTYRALPTELRDEPELRLLYARALVKEGREGLLEKALEGHDSWTVSPEGRGQLAAALEGEGFLELAISQLEVLYLKQAGGAQGERLFDLRRRRDERGGVLSSRAARDLLGRDFTEIEPLAAGGMGLVLRARRRQDGVAVAIKTLHPRKLEDPEALAAFRREAAALKELELDGVPRLLAVSKGRLPFLVIPLIEGHMPSPDLALAERLEIACQLCARVEALHSAGWIHRDFHPGNVLVDPSGNTYLIDFGLAGPDGSPGVPAGTPGFAPPEQLEGKAADPSQDVYALGATLEKLGPWAPELEALLVRMQALNPEVRPPLASLMEVLKKA